MKVSKKSIKNKGKYRSLFEKNSSIYMHDKFGDNNWSYESEKISYTIPESNHFYTPDFIVNYKGCKFYCEFKGVFKLEDRKKMLNIIRSNPTINLIMVFQRPENKINKKSNTTYSKWCDKNNIDWCSIDNIDCKIKEIHQRINNKILNNI